MPGSPGIVGMRGSPGPAVTANIHEIFIYKWLYIYKTEVTSTSLLPVSYIKGDVGPPGLSGDPGKDGPIGPIGPAGVRGKRGRRGTAGDRGNPGLPGKIGEIGPIGEPGSVGETGRPGVSGREVRNILLSSHSKPQFSIWICILNVISKHIEIILG